MRKLILKAVAAAFGLDVVFVSPQVKWLVEAARPFVEEAEVLPDTGGEYRRGWVYGHMLNLHPKTPRKDIALAIEMALR